MGKVAKTSSTRKVTPKLKNKRRKKEVDKIHSKILKAKSKLDNIEKHGTKTRQKKQNQAKICNRLLPKPVAGIYRNGAKGKDIQKAETSENKINNARLKADALQLFNGDTPESKEEGAEITLFDEPIAQSPTKRFVENSLEWAACGSEESPVIGRQDHNQNMCLVKKKSEDTFFKNSSNRNRKDVNKSKDTVQKEVICKRKLFQNDEQLRAVNASTLQIFDTIDLTQGGTSEEKEETCLKDKSCSSFNKDTFWNPSSRYKEFCKKMSAGISDGFTQIYRLDPVKMALKKLRINYTECLRQQLLREKRAQSVNTESVEYQACTYSGSQISPVEFEVPKCDDENDTIAANLSESITQKTNKVHRMSHFMREKVNDMTQYDSTSRSSQNSFAAYTNDENNVNQCADVFQPLKMNLCFANETHSVDAQKNSNHVGRASKQNRHKKDDFFVNYNKHPRGIDNTGHPATLIFSKDSALSAEKPLPKLPTAVADTCALNDTFRKRNDRTANEYNIKNIKQIPKIIRRCNDISNTNKILSTQVNDICTESLLHKKFETTLFNNGPNNHTANRSRATEYPNVLDSVLTSSISNISFQPTSRYLTIPFDRSQLLERPIKCNYISKISPFDRSKLSEPQIKSMKIKNIPRFNIEQANQIPSRTKVHMCESGKQQFIGGDTRDQNPHILFNSVGNKVAPTATLGCLQNSQCDKRCGEPTCEKLFSKADAERSKTRTDQNACRCNEQCIYHNSADYPFKHNVSQARHFHEDTVRAQPGTSYEINAYTSNTDKPADTSGGLRNVSFLPVEQKCNPYTYLKAADGQHRVELLQNATQPIKYFAVKNDSGVRRIPVYINNGTVEMTENVPLKVVALMDPSSRTKAYAQEVTNQIIPLQANGLPVNEFAVNRTNVQPVLFSSDLQSNTWYASNL